MSVEELKIICAAIVSVVAIAGIVFVIYLGSKD